MPRPDSAVLVSLEELTARTRAIARSLMDYPAQDGSPRIAASCADDYARMLRLLASAVRQLADLRSDPPPGQELADASDYQHRLEIKAARQPDHSRERSIAQRVTRLAADMINEAGMDQA